MSRVMYYCHDTFGLGHLRRSLTLARYLRDRTPSLSQLLVTGSPVAQSFPLPEGADFVKLPSVVKVGAGRYEARSISAPFGEVLSMRGEMLLSAARHFRPEALVIDHAPAGLEGEALETLRYLKRNFPATRLVTGLRDVLDEASTVRRTWEREGVYELLEDLYDLILVYGQRDVYDVVEEYGLSARTAAKTRYLGYLRRASGARTPGEIRAELGTRTDRLVVVTTGGGGDGAELLDAAVEALRLKSSSADYDCLLIGGPLMPRRDRKRLLEAADPGRGVHVLPSTTDMTSYIGAADAVVSMGGYNTVSELLSLRRPAVIVPRVAPRQEQLIRAQALSRRGLVRMLHPAELTPCRLLRETERLLNEPFIPVGHVDLDGLPRFATELEASVERARFTPELLAPRLPTL